MQRLKIFALLTCFVFVKSPVFPQSPDNETTEKRNEFGVNLLPVVISLTGAELYEPEFQLFFKRSFKDNEWAIRSDISVLPVRWDNWWANNYEVTAFTDSTETRLYSRQSLTPVWMLSAGLEKRFGGKLQKYVGADAVGNYSRQENWRSEEIYERDLSGHGGFSFLSSESRLIEQDKIVDYGGGFRVFFGFRLPISKRFMIAAEGGMTGRMTFSNVTRTFPESAKWTVTTIDFEGWPIQNLSMAYRF